VPPIDGRLPVLTAEARLRMKSAHLEMIAGVRDQGLTYGQITSLLGLQNESSLRSYVAAPGEPRHESPVLRAIHAAIVDPEGHLSSLIPPVDRERYSQAFLPTLPTTISYRRKKDKTFDNDQRAAISEIFHDIYNIKNKMAVRTMAALVGSYEMYRLSVDAGFVVRSHIEFDIGQSGDFVSFHHGEPGGDFIGFGRYRRTDGVAIRVGDTIHALGNVENGQSGNFLYLRHPSFSAERIVFGFNTSTSNDGVVFSTRCVLLRRDERQPITHLSFAELEASADGFVAGLLTKRGDARVADNTRLISGR
jgi:hypothetical protein